MTPANPLIAGPVNVSTPFTGTFLLEDGESLASAIKNGDWVSGGMAAFGAVLDTVAAVSDPLGTLIAMGLGWVMEHIEPLRGWMNDLTGDAGQVAGFAATWGNVAAQLTASADDLMQIMRDVDGMDGQTMAAYKAFQADAGTHIRAAGSWADAMSVGLQLCSTIVKIVHDITRDAISQVVGAVVSYATELVVSVGFATPLVIEQVSTRVAALAERIGKSITRLLESGKALEQLLDKLQALLKRAGDLFDGVLHGKPSSAAGPELIQTGGRSGIPKDPELADRWADEVYDEIRNSGTDVSAITGHESSTVLPDGHVLTADEVSQIKSHLFTEEHPLYDYETGGTVNGRFDSDPEIAAAWQRLQNGTATDTDRLLMSHELAESNYMNSHPGASYREAHEAANQVANWDKAIRAR